MTYNMLMGMLNPTHSLTDEQDLLQLCRLRLLNEPISLGVSRWLGKSFAFAVIYLCVFRDGTW